MTKPVELSDLDALRAENEALRQQVKNLTLRAIRAEALADHDALTPALNRRGFMVLLNRILSYGQRHDAPAVLVYFDLDRFKSINDELGHAAGDAALIHVAHILLANVRESDAVGRLGGDEFAVILLQTSPEEGHAKACQLVEIFAATPLEWEGHRVAIGGSFGLRALDDQSTAEAWLAEADAAMWLRKKDGRAEESA